MNATDISQAEKVYSEQIYSLRSSGRICEAITVCQKAMREYSASGFFYRICGDMYYSQANYAKALDAYMEFVKRIKNQPEYFTDFARVFKKINEAERIERKYFNKLAAIIINDEYAIPIRNGMTNLLLDTYQSEVQTTEMIENIMAGKASYEQVKDSYLRCVDEGLCSEISYLLKTSEKECSRRDYRVNRYLLSKLEKKRLYPQALVMVRKILMYTNDAVMIRTMFRICRVCEDYTVAEEYLKEKKIEEKEEFNIQYELVLYFNSIGNEEKRNTALEKIEKLSENNMPICNTLFKLYVEYNLLDKAQEFQKKIRSKGAGQETEDVVWDRLRNLVSEQEHTRQLLAMSELIKGFSHELGQPITNIRYAVQLHNRKCRKFGRVVPEAEKELLDSVLRQTERVGRLLDRFAPLTSSRSEKKYFKVLPAIEGTFQELAVRLQNENIRHKVSGDEELMLYGEELQFSQVFYNLIINAIYAIRHCGRQGILDVVVRKEKNVLKIEFADNGIGIPTENQKKIFNPFFSTKNKEIEEGGEGLGLFIVWNIVKMFSGKIYIDDKYTKGAKFVIEINQKENGNV